MADYRNIVILTGAGISAESGLRTFRADDGLWEDHHVEEIATPEGFAANPGLVQRFYDARRADVMAANPNAAHLALARLDDGWRHDLLIVTQNIDDLHERAGARRVLHMHGQALGAWCTACDARHTWRTALLEGPPCPSCGAHAQSTLRPPRITVIVSGSSSARSVVQAGLTARTSNTTLSEGLPETTASRRAPFGRLQRRSSSTMLRHRASSHSSLSTKIGSVTVTQGGRKVL